MTRNVTVTNALGLNATNAPLLVQRANGFKSTILLQTEDRQVNAKSLLGVISLGVKKGTVITLTAEGADAQDALDAVCGLVENGFAQ